MSDDTDSDYDNIDAEEIADVGEESGKPNNKKKAKPDEEEKDDLIKALKAAREKKVRNSPPDIKLNCMGTVRSGTKLVVGSGTGSLYLFRWILLLSSVVSLHSGISLSVSYQVGLVACATVNYMLSLEFASFLPNSWKLHGTGSNFEF